MPPKVPSAREYIARLGIEKKYNAELIPATDAAVAASALANEGGKDVAFFLEVIAQLDCGWGAWELRVRELNEEYDLNPSLPSFLVSTFRHQMRQELALLNYDLVPEHGRLIGQALRLNSCPYLTRLVLHFTMLGDKGAIAVAEGLEGNTSLQTLHVTHSYVGDEGLFAFCRALLRNRHLVFLHLEGNNITDVGATRLAAALEVNKTLQSLLIGDNCMSSVGTAALSAIFMKRPRSLCDLSFRSMRDAHDLAPYEEPKPNRRGGLGGGRRKMAQWSYFRVSDDDDDDEGRSGVYDAEKHRRRFRRGRR